MISRKWISDLVEPGKPGVISQVYDCLMLVAIALGTVSLLYRVLKTLQQFSEVFGPERQVSVCREISKVHEESVRGTLAEVIAHFQEHEPRGEFVIVVAGNGGRSPREE